MDLLWLIVSIATPVSVLGVGGAFIWIKPPKWAAQVVNRAKRIRSAEADVTFEERLERMKKRAVEAPKKPKRQRSRQQLAAERSAYSYGQWKGMLEEAKLGATQRQLAEANRETSRLVHAYPQIFSTSSAAMRAAEEAQDQLRIDHKRLRELEEKYSELQYTQYRLEEYARSLRKNGAREESRGSYSASYYEPGDAKMLVEISQPKPGRIVGGRMDLSNIYADTIFNSDPHAVDEAEKNRRALKAETSIVAVPRHEDVEVIERNKWGDYQRYTRPCPCMTCTGRGPITPSELMARSITEFERPENVAARAAAADELARKAKAEADAMARKVADDDFSVLLSELSKKPVEKRDSYDDLGDDEAESLENEIVGEPAEWVDDLIAEQWPTMSAELRKKVADEWASLGLESVVR